MTVAEMAAAVALDVKEQIDANDESNRVLAARIKELEKEAATAQAAQATVETAVAERDADISALRDENKELGETITFLQERLEALDGKPAPEPPEKKTIFGKPKDRNKDHRTQTPGVTYRESDKGPRFYVWYTEDGKTRKELIGDDYTEAVERKVELNEQREKATA